MMCVISWLVSDLHLTSYGGCILFDEHPHDFSTFLQHNYDIFWWLLCTTEAGSGPVPKPVGQYTIDFL